MDGAHFDELARRLSCPSSRRFALGGMLAGLLLPLDAVVRGKSKQRKGKDKKRKRAQAQAEPCWRAGACIVSKGSNVSQCDLGGYTAPDGLDCTRCNLSRANLRGADLTGVNFTRANLSGACLVDADFTGATFANSTNLANAIFCNTTMPDNSINDSGCGLSTACCNCTPSCTGKCGGASDGCGGTCTGTCEAGLVCVGGACVNAQGTCPTGFDSCTNPAVRTCNNRGDCFCRVTTEGDTRCGGNVLSVFCGECASTADCTELYPSIPGVFCRRSGTGCCNGTAPRGLCDAPCPS